MLLYLLGLIGNIILYILLTVLFVVLLILLVPFRYRASGFRDEDEMQIEGAVGWLFGFILATFSVNAQLHFQMKLLLFGRFSLMPHLHKKAKPVRGNTKDVEKKNEKLKEKKNKRKFVMTLEKGKRMVRSVLRLLSRMAPRDLMVDGHIGFEDPAATGYLCAILSPLESFIQKHPRHFQVHITPVFEESRLSGMFRIKGHILVWFIVWEALKLAISKPFRQDIFGRKRPKVKQIIGGFEHV